MSPDTKENMTEEEKKEKAIMKKYYRSRYSSFLKTLNDKNKAKEDEINKIRQKEEKREAKKKELVAHVHSKFMEATT
jgi:hypothetical protein